MRAASGAVSIANYPREATGRQPELRLTRKEAELLELLRRNAGRCLTREYLLATVWGYRDGTRTRTPGRNAGAGQSAGGR